MILHSGISAIEGIAIMKDDAYTRKAAPSSDDLWASKRAAAVCIPPSPNPGVFPPYAHQLIRIGEETGHLGDVCLSFPTISGKRENQAETIKAPFPIL